ncbi:MAG: hypothetical protein RLN88_15480 [Ekhidna sp.]|uniref:hypothetical protein n=1 Tax=Ekhidna sp. TaxID=2608089 RepID=UPI0032EE4C14
MRDNLKDHIENTREDFELYPFNSDQEWVKISGKIKPQTEKKDPWRTFGIAACFACIIGCTIFFMNATGPENEMAEMEQYYNAEINQKVTLIKSQLGDDSILKDLEAMDAAFAELRTDLKDNVDNEEVVTAMMENYRLKLKILEEILSELEKEKSEEVL